VTKLNRNLKIGMGLILAVTAGLSGKQGPKEPPVIQLSLSEREPNSMSFPRVREQNDLDNVLEEYEVYLRYVMEVGNQTNRKQSQRLGLLFRELKRRDEGQAARFLRGLRFEMVQKIEMTGMAPERASTSNAAIRSWVNRFLPIWVREADEYLFRARTNALVKRQS